MIENEKRFEEIRIDIIEFIKSKIENRTKGLLYNSLKIIINSLYSPHLATELLNDICSNLNIKKNSNIDDDMKIVSLYPVYHYTGTAKNEEDLQEGANQAKKKFKDAFNYVNNFFKNEDSKMELIIIGATTIVGGIFFVWYNLQHRNESSLANPATSNTNLIYPDEASICLVVPANSAASYVIDTNLTLEREEIIHLIDDSSHFYCSTLYNAESLELNVDDREMPLKGSNLKFYLRIDVRNIGEVIGAKTKYQLKSELPSNVDGKVTKIGRIFIKADSDINKFNQI